MKTAAALAIMLALVACAGRASADPMRRAPACASVTIAQQTTTGHEADLPVRMCGGMRTGTWACYVTPWGPLLANSRLRCSRLR